MIQFPNAKINLGLNVVNKRSDGYHNLETVFYPIPIFDSLEVLQSVGADGGYEFSSSGLSVDGTPENNLIIKALKLISKECRIPYLKIHLHKLIPMGGGLGGGSSDGAFMLKMLNEMFELNLSNEQLIKMAVNLGADCPFFISNRCSYATGIGEVLEPINLSLANTYLVLLNPNIHVSTSLAFSKIVPIEPTVCVRDIVSASRDLWKDDLVNDFEYSVFSAFPIIKDIKESLYCDGAFYASMSGSGASVYALFETKPKMLTYSEYTIWEGYL